MEMGFKYAVMKVNNDTLLLPDLSLEYDIQYAYREDSFHAAKKGPYPVQCTPPLRIVHHHCV